MNQIIKTSKVIHAILKALFWGVAAISAVSFAAIVVVLLAKDYTSSINEISITLGNYALRLNQAYSLNQLTSLLCITLVNVVLFGVLSCYAIRILGSVFQPMSQGKPFGAAISGALKKLSYIVLAFGITGIILQLLTNHIFYDTFDIASLLDADRVKSCSISVISDGSFVIWFIILRLFSYIFRYGETLQQLSDETL